MCDEKLDFYTYQLKYITKHNIALKDIVYNKDFFYNYIGNYKNLNNDEEIASIYKMLTLNYYVNANVDEADIMERLNNLWYMIWIISSYKIINRIESFNVVYLEKIDILKEKLALHNHPGREQILREIKCILAKITT